MGDEPKENVKKGPWRLFFLATLFALLAGLGTAVFLHFEENRLKEALTPKPKDMTEVVVAVHDLPIGTRIDSQTMAVRAIPSEYVGDDAIRPNEFGAITGAVLIKGLGKGKMLTREVIDLDIPKDFAATVREGFRAVTIQVDEINSISGMIRPGNRVDLYSRMAEASDAQADASGGTMVIPVLENVLVLATGKSGLRPNEDEFNRLDTDDRSQSYTTLTLEVSPRDVALLSLADNSGTIIAALKNVKDSTDPDFERLTMTDLFGHAAALRQAAENKLHNRELDGVHKDSTGRLVTRDGVVITDPNVHLNSQGLLVTKDGVVLNGRDLTVDSTGHIRDSKGNTIDTATLVGGKNDSLVDAKGNVLTGNGYQTTKGGFLVDKDGRIMTPDGHVLTGLKLAPDGTVRTGDGKILAAGDITVDPDGTVHLAAGQAVAAGALVTGDGHVVLARDLVTVDPDGAVRTKDGKILEGVHVDKDGNLIDADGHTLSAAEVVLAGHGERLGPNGTIIDSNGKALTARDLVTIDPDGTVRTKDGKILEGVHVDKDGNLIAADGHTLSAADVELADQGLRRPAAGETMTADGRIQPPGTVADITLAGVKADSVANFAAGLMAGNAKKRPLAGKGNYEVEYIVGGAGADGTAKTFIVKIDDK